MTSQHTISIWGTSKTGKTTYLAMLYHEALQNPMWYFEETNNAADKFVKEMHHKIYVERTFPKGTEGYHEYTYRLTRLNGDGSVAFVVSLEFNDIAGEVYEWFYEDGRKTDTQNAGGIAPQAWFDRISNSDGLLMLLDPSWNDRTTDKPYNALVMDFLRQLRKRRKIDASHDPRLQTMYIALCLTKADALANHWQKIDDWTCGRADEGVCHDDCPVRDLMPDFMDKHLAGLVVPDHARCFLLSAIGRADGGDAGLPNVMAAQQWARRTTPVPPRLTPDYGDVATSELDSLADTLRDLDDLLERAGLDSATTGDYFPGAIRDVAQIRPTNLLQPLEWIVTSLNQNAD